MVKLTKSGRELLRLLSTCDRYDITNESVVKALARNGFAERYSESIGYLKQRHMWRITEAGRAALAASEGRDNG